VWWNAASFPSAGSRAEDITSAAAEVLRARGDLATIQAQVNDTVIRAPFAGAVSQKYADVGTCITPTTSASATSSATSSSILALASELEAVANVAEVDVGAIRPGQPVDLQVDAFPRQRFRGVVRLVAPEAVVEQVGLADRMANRLNQLSGGQQQRVAIARALANKPERLLADEPTGALDSRTGAEVIELMSGLHADGLTLVLVTHDTLVAQNCGRIIQIQDGQISRSAAG
jgi:ABC-type branched-subunit amino acid transport system ATPase component